MWYVLAAGLLFSPPDTTDSLRKAAEALKPREDSTQKIVRRGVRRILQNDEALNALVRVGAVFLAYSVIGDPRHRAFPLREIRVGGIHTLHDLYQGYFLEGRALDLPGRMGGFALGASWLHFEDPSTVFVVGLGGLVWTLGNRFFPLVLSVGGSYADANLPDYPLYGVGGYAEFQPFHLALPVWPVVRYEHHVYTFDWGYKPGNLWGWSWGVRGALGPFRFFYLFRDLRAGGAPFVFRVLGMGIAG